MSWRDRLRPAKFREASFFVLDTRDEFGRRNVLHQYPFRDIPYAEDLGKEADTFVINGYVIQSLDNNFDHWDERDALRDALKETGPGTLVHPYLGEIQVSVIGKTTLTQTSSRDQGIARFTMTFVESGQRIYPSQSISIEVSVDNEATTAEANVTESFEETGNEETAYDFDDTMDSSTGIALNMMKATLATLKTTSSVISDAKLKVTQAQATLSSGAGTPSTISSIISNGFDGFLTTMGLLSGETEVTSFSISAVQSIVDALLEMATFGESPDSDDVGAFKGTINPIIVNSKITARQAAFQEELINMVRAIALIRATRIAVRNDYDSYNGAIETMTQITDAMDSFILKLGNDSANTDLSAWGISINTNDLFLALNLLRPKFVKSMVELGASLAKVVYYTVPPGVMSTIELAYDRYLDVDRASEIYGRNLPTIVHPGFLPSKKTVEILSE
jgi:prophage DNA circulation protein